MGCSACDLDVLEAGWERRRVDMGPPYDDRAVAAPGDGEGLPCIDLHIAQPGGQRRNVAFAGGILAESEYGAVAAAHEGVLATRGHLDIRQPRRQGGDIARSKSVESPGHGRSVT